MFEPGSHLQIHYPCKNDIRCISKIDRLQRSLEIIEVRDILADPLTAEEFLCRPYVNRSRWLALARDLDRKCWRKFYLGVTDEFAAPTTLRLALYDREKAKPAEFLAREFHPTVRDRNLMIRLIERWKEQDHGEMLLRICCYDLRLIG